MKTIQIFTERANVVSLRFINRDDEAKFRAYYFDKYLWQLRLAHVLALVFFSVALFTEYLIADLSWQHVFVSIIIVSASFSIGLFITYVFRDFYKKYYQYFNFYYVLITSATFIVFGYITKEPEKYSMYSGIFVCLIFNYTFIRHFFVGATISGFLVLAGFFVSTMVKSTFSDYHILMSILFTVVHLLGMFIAYSIEYDSRKSFLMLKQIQRGADEIVAINESLESKISRRTKELELAKNMAEESDRLKSSFLANMSHEIRTPMNGILGFLDLMKGKDVSEKEREEYIEIIEKSGERLLTTINDIIEISKIESGDARLEIKVVNLNEMLDYLYHLFQKEAASRGLNLEYDLISPEDFCELKSDSYKIEAIMINLIKNALKFTKKGEVRFGCRINKDEITFFVKDSGIGISESRIEAVFERFVQADLSINRGHEGSGLGLPICKAYAEMLGANLNVESKVNEGSEFYFSLKCEAASLK